MRAIEEGAISISFDNVLAEHLAAERLYYKSTTLAKVDKVVAAILLLVGVLSTFGAGVQWWTLVFLPVGVLEWFNLLTIRPLVNRYAFRRNPKFSETYHLKFDRTGMQFRTNSIDSHITWDDFTKVLEDDQLWLLVYGARMYSVIPKRAFKSDDEATRFRSLVTERIPGRKGSAA